jgi:PKD repeat protein
VPPLTVKFQNFSGGQALRFLWDFGDGTTSTDEAPTHTYVAEGNYTVTLNMQTTTGAQGISIKSNYISVSQDNFTPFFYFLPLQGYSITTAADRTARGVPTTATTFTFVDQTDAAIAQRFWIFDDGTTDSEPNPDIHTTSHVYKQPGVYSPALLIVLGDQSQKRAFLYEQLVVL